MNPGDTVLVPRSSGAVSRARIAQIDPPCKLPGCECCDGPMALVRWTESVPESALYPHLACRRGHRERFIEVVKQKYVPVRTLRAV